MNAILGGGQSLRRISWVVAALLLAVALLASCNTFRQPTPTPEPTAAPTATQTPSPTAVPSTPTPQPPAPSSGPTGIDFDITPITTWEDLFNRFSAEEQSCIRSEISEAQLAAALAAPVMSEGDEPGGPDPLLACLAPETAGSIFLAFLAAEAGLTGDAKTCLKEKFAEVDPALVYVAMTDPESDPAAQAALFALFVSAQECALEGVLPGPGVEQPQFEVEALWSSSVGGLVGNAPALAYGVVYAGSDDNHVYAFDSATGDLLWSRRTREAVRSTPTVADGIVYVSSNDNHIYAFDSGTGTRLWTYDTGAWAQYSPTVADGKVYFGASSEIGFTIHALEGVSGELEWKSETPFSVSPGAYANGRGRQDLRVRRSGPVLCPGRIQRRAGVEL